MDPNSAEFTLTGTPILIANVPFGLQIHSVPNSSSTISFSTNPTGSSSHDFVATAGDVYGFGLSIDIYAFCSVDGVVVRLIGEGPLIA